MPTLHNAVELIPVKEKVPEQISSSLLTGITEKRILCDQFGAHYLLKKSDPLTFSDVFKGYLSDKELENPSFDPTEHIFSIQLESAFLETLMSRIANKLFSGILIVPELYLHVEKDKSITIISKFLRGFSEFLSHKEIVNNESLFYREHIPKRADLSLTPEEAKILGQLYAVALVLNLWDLLNSRLLNSGYCVDADATKLAAIVDFGYAGTLSYKGRHIDTLALDNPDFLPSKKINYSFFGQSYRDHYRHIHVLPFDQLVPPLLPHLIIANLFDMSGTDPISQSMLEGYCQALSTAEKNIWLNPHLLEDALAQAYDEITLDSSIKAAELKTHLNAEFYGKPAKDSHTLIGTLQQRLISAKMLISRFKEGVYATTIQEEIRDIYYYSQCGKSKGPYPA